MMYRNNKIIEKELDSIYFHQFIGLHYSNLKYISIYQWYPLVDSYNLIENFISSDFESLYFNQSTNFNKNDYKLDNIKQIVKYKKNEV